MQMKGKNVFGIYPFAVNFFVTVAQVFFVIMGARVSYTCKLLSGFLGCGAIMIALPFLARLEKPLNF
jgi:hypothetical protein